MSFRLTNDARADARRAIERDHGPCDSNCCDISAALEAGFPLAAADLLTGATECPSVDAVLAGHAVDPRDELVEWGEWAKQHSLECPCGATAYFPDGPPTARWTCSNCAATNEAPRPWTRGPAVRAALAALRDVAQLARRAHFAPLDPALQLPGREAAARERAAELDGAERALIEALRAAADVARAARAGEWSGN